jgi:hypothetical protein
MESLENGLFAKNVAPDFVSLPIYPLGKRISRRSAYRVTSRIHFPPQMRGRPTMFLMISSERRTM